MKRFFFIISIIVFYQTNGFLMPLLRKLTPINIIQGGFNNTCLGIIYYLLCIQKEQKQEIPQEFIKNTKPWTDSPNYLKRFQPRIFISGHSPSTNPVTYFIHKNNPFYLINQKLFIPYKIILKHKKESISDQELYDSISLEYERQSKASAFESNGIDPFLNGKNPFYLINGKLYISHQVIFEYKKGSISDQELYNFIIFEYERQSKASAFESNSVDPFLRGIGKFIFAKKFISKFFYPTFRPWFNQKGWYFFSWSFSYPKIALCSLADFFVKFFCGVFNLKRNQKNKYIESCQEVFNHWTEIEARNKRKNQGN